MKKLFYLFLVTPFFLGSPSHASTRLETERFDINYYHLFSLDPVGTTKKKLRHADGEGNPEHWNDLGNDDLSMIDWLEKCGVPFCKVEGARLVYHKKRELLEAVESGEINCGVIEVTNTPTNLGILEYKLVGRTNQYLRMNNQASEQIEIKGFPMPHEIGPNSFTGLDPDDLTRFFEEWKEQLPDQEIHFLRRKGHQSGLSLYVRYDPTWCRERGLWKFKERWIRFSKERWSNIYDSTVVRKSITSDDSSEIFISFLPGLNSRGVVVGDGLNESDFSSVISAFREIKKIEFMKDYVMSGSRAVDLLERLIKWESGYLLIFRGGFQISSSMKDGAFVIDQVMYSGY